MWWHYILKCKCKERPACLLGSAGTIWSLCIWDMSWSAVLWVDAVTSGPALGQGERGNRPGPLLTEGPKIEQTWFNFLEQKAMSRLGSIFLNERAAGVLIKAFAVTNYLDHHVLVPLSLLTNTSFTLLCYAHLDSCLLNTYSDVNQCLLTTSMHNWLLNLCVYVSWLYKLM